MKPKLRDWTMNYRKEKTKLKNLAENLEKVENKIKMIW
jgi:hypothetical protein